MENGIENPVDSIPSGTYAEPPVAGDKIIYVGRGAGASDSNSGLSAGKAKATLAAALNALTTGGMVQLLAGTFPLTFSAHPVDGAYMVGAIVRGKTVIRGLGAVSVLQIAANQPSGYALLNADIGGGTDNDIVFEDFVLDGNNVNQGGTAIHHGIATIRARNVVCNRVTVKNCRGTATSGASESFHFEHQLGADISHIDCVAYRDAGSTASGFSANGCTGVSYVACRAYGMSVTNGFTHNQCADVRHVNCRAFLNAENGFNSEVSTDVSYIGCTSGGTAGTAATARYSVSQDLGNTNIGFAVNGSSKVELVGCVAKNNVGSGLFSLGGASGRIVGGDFSDNGGYGMFFLDAQPDGPWTIDGSPRLVNNTSGELAVTPLGASGLTGLVATPAIPASGDAVVNPFPHAVTVYITPGTGTIFFISINGTNVATTSGAHRIPPGGTVSMVYGGGTPVWVWFGT